MRDGLLTVPTSTEAPACAPDACAVAARALTADADFWALFEEKRLLGRGCFGTVLLVQPRSRTRAGAAPLLAAKVVLAEDAADALQEAAILRSLKHPHIVSLHDVFASRSTVYVVMRAELGGDLRGRAERASGGVLTESEALRPMSGVLAALCHLHGQHGIVHRDIKASNVLLAADGVTAKLGDFGLAARLPPSGLLTCVCGTHDFLAPEMIRTGHGECAGYNCSVDMWAVGLMLHGLLLGHNPFERETDIETLQAILAGDYAPPADGERLGPAVSELLAALLRTEPARRATAEDAAGHAWLACVAAARPSAGRRPRLIERLWPRAG